MSTSPTRSGMIELIEESEYSPEAPLNPAQKRRKPISLFTLLAGFAALLFIFARLSSSTLFSSYQPLGPGYYDNASQFVLKDHYVGEQFLNKWRWETFDDPTHGRVNYVDQRTALASNLTFASEDKFVMRADDTKKVWRRARGRDSVRIISKQAYDDALFVLDLEHMPEGCATWPAFWTLSQKGPWPKGGEIDIIEGTNLDPQNLASLHTLPGCKMSSSRQHSGSATASNCDASQNFNQGCGVSFTSSSSTASFGSSFNKAKGGWYVMSKTASKGVQVWFWSRNDPNVPPEIKNVPSSGDDERSVEVKPEAWWGTPDATFPPDDCDWKSHFDAHAIVFDLTFCGDWAGSVWPSSPCASKATTCETYVNNFPSEFSNAYWEINSLRVYTPHKSKLLDIALST